MSFRRLLFAVILPSLFIVPTLAQQIPQAQPHRQRPVRMQLQLFSPKLDAPLLSGCAATIAVPYLYTGVAPLTFSLAEGPPGMTIDGASGTLRWTPLASFEGSASPVRVAATDGAASSSITFAIPVAATAPLATSVSGSTVRITAPGSLSDVAFTFPSGASTPAALVGAGRIDPTNAPPIPAGYQQLSDLFRLTPSASRDGPIVITVPAKLVPAGRRPEDVRILLFAEPLSDAGGRQWVPSWTDLDVKQDGSITMSLYAVGELSCLAIADRPAATSQPLAIEGVSSAVGPSATNIDCSPLTMSNGRVDSSRSLCAVTGDVTFTVTLKDVATNQWQPSATTMDIASWLARARKMMPDIGLGPAERFEVVVEPNPKGDYGFVLGSELFLVLHLNSAAYARAEMQGAAVHEYFHLAQGFTLHVAHSNLLMNNYRENAWASEGTARWFEDQVFDDLDTYRLKERSPAPEVLAVGLNAFPNANLPATRPYARFAFFKLVSSRCPDFKAGDVVNAHAPADPTGLEDFTEHLQDWRCSFADKVTGIDPASIGAALLEYAFQTVGQNSMGALDGNELSFNFKNSDHLIYADPLCTSSGPCPTWSRRQWTMRTTSAAVLRVAPVDSVPAGREAVLQIRPLEFTELMAWVGSDETGGIEGGRWLRVDATSTVVYKTSGRAPRTLVILVNDDPDVQARVEVRAMLRSTGPQEVTTPISAALTWQPADVVVEKYVKDYVTWSGSVNGSVTAPENVTVTVSRGQSRVTAKACAPNSAAFTIVMNGSLSASPSLPNGKRPHPAVAGAELEWLYSNPRMIAAFNDPSVSVSGSSITATVPVVKNAWFGKIFGGCIAYDLDQWTVFPDGRKQKFGETQQVCQTGLVLDLRVGGPPDCS